MNKKRKRPLPAAKRALKAGVTLRAWVKQPGHSAYRLWKLSLVPRGVLYRALDGGFPSVPHAIRIARVMGMRVEAIWGGDVSKVPNPIENFEFIDPDDDLIELGSTDDDGDSHAG